MQPSQETLENQHLDLELEAEAQENQKFQPSPRHLELLGARSIRLFEAVKARVVLSLSLSALKLV